MEDREWASDDAPVFKQPLKTAAVYSMAVFTLTGLGLAAARPAFVHEMDPARFGGTRFSIKRAFMVSLIAAASVMLLSSGSF